MEISQQQVVERARNDLASRLGIDKDEIVQTSITETDFPDAALGASVDDEMSAQVITPGWRIRLNANGQIYEYRTNNRQLRLYNFKGENYRI